MSHAILSPSAASRWLACTPSARLEQQFPDKAGAAAAEGSLAHALAELEIRMSLGIIIGAYYKSEKDKLKASPYYEKAMEDYIGDYATYIIEQYNTALAHTKDAKIFLEQKVDMTDYVPDGFGTADVQIIADRTLRIIDLKYGKGVPVSAVNNKQMMLYALGSLKAFDWLYDIQEVHMTIHQPRLDSVSDWLIPVSDLREWAETELKPKAKIAFAGEGDFAPGDHCRFCKAKATCKALADYNLELAKHEFTVPALLSDDAIADILGRVDLLTQWAKAVQEHALAEAINGKRWDGWKIVEGRSNRIYSDAAKVEEALLATKAWTNEQLYAPKHLLGITALEKSIGKASFTETVGPLLIKPAGKPALVPATDKRPEYSSVSSAAVDFAEDLDC